MNNSSAISILIPAKNAEETIHIAIEDALMQQGIDLRIIVANDNSTDDTVKIIKAYQENHSNIKIINTPEPGGIVAGRNALLKACETPYLAWLDADDGWPRKDKLKRQIEFLDKNTECAVVGDGKVKGVYLESLRQKTFRFPLSYEDIKARLLFKNAFIMSSLVCKTELVKDINFQTEMEYLEDYVWVMDIAKIYQLRNITLGGTLHFIHPEKKQEVKHENYRVFEKEASLLFDQVSNLGIEINEKEAYFLSQFFRRNFPLSKSKFKLLHTLLHSLKKELVSKGYDKESLSGLFFDVKLRALKCRWFK